MKFLATPAAANAWAKQGGFATGNEQRQPRARTRMRSTAPTRRRAARRSQVVFDMSDEQPAAFGSTTGQGEWGLFQTFLKNPSNVDRHRQAARGRGSGRLQEGQVARLSAGGITAEPPVTAAPPAPTGRSRASGPLPHGWRLPRARALPARRLAPLPDRLHDRPQLLRADRLPRKLGRDRQLQDALHDLDADDGDQEQRDLGRGRAGARHRARADLRRADRDACAGRSRSRPPSSCRWRSRRSRPASPGGSCTSRIPGSARSTRSRKIGLRRLQPGRRALAGVPVDPAAPDDPVRGARAEDAVSPGRRRAARAHRHPAGRGAEGRRPGGRAGGEAGRDRRRRLARLHAGRRQARRGRQGRARAAGRDRRSFASRPARPCKSAKSAPNGGVRLHERRAGELPGGDRRRRRSQSRSAASPGSGRT